MLYAFFNKNTCNATYYFTACSSTTVRYRVEYLSANPTKNIPSDPSLCHPFELYNTKINSFFQIQHNWHTYELTVTMIYRYTAYPDILRTQVQIGQNLLLVPSVIIVYVHAHAWLSDIVHKGQCEIRGVLLGSVFNPYLYVGNRDQTEVIAFIQPVHLPSVKSPSQDRISYWAHSLLIWIEVLANELKESACLSDPITRASDPHCQTCLTLVGQVFKWTIQLLNCHFDF